MDTAFRFNVFVPVTLEAQ